MPITEDVTTITPTVYTPPVYRKETAKNLHYKIFSDTKMVVVDSTSGKEKITVENYPTGRFTAIANTEASIQVDYETDRDAVIVIIEAL